MSPDRDLLTTPLTAPLLRGVLELEPTVDGVRLHRLPGWARAQVDDPQLALVEAQPAGVRLVFRTSATTIELRARPTKRAYAGLPPRPDGVYDLVVDGQMVAQQSIPDGDVMAIDLMTGRAEVTPGPVGAVRFEGLTPGAKDVELWLPHDESTELVALLTDQPVEPAPQDSRPRWLHHGSSISHGSNATHPTGTWPVVAARRAGVDVHNLGLGGSAMLDPFTARVLRDQPADLISLKLGINLVNGDLMRLRAFVPAVHGFLDTIREGHPETPLLVVSPILCPMVEDVPGPTLPDLAALASGELRYVASGDPADVVQGRLTLQVIRRALAEIVDRRSSSDPHLHYLDGRLLYGEADAEALPLPDDLHPDGEAHELIGRRFADLALTGDGPLSRG